MYNQIMRKNVIFPDPLRHDISMSDECKDFISMLLDKNPNNRLGTQNDVEEVLAHPWLKSHDDSEAILKKKVKAPFKPQLS